LTPLRFEERPSTEALGGARIDRKEFIVRPVDGRKPLNAMVSGLPLRDAHGQINGASLFFHDITDIQENSKRSASSPAAWRTISTTC
jgi:hypothetical protein